MLYRGGGGSRIGLVRDVGLLSRVGVSFLNHGQLGRRGWFTGEEVHTLLTTKPREEMTLVKEVGAYLKVNRRLVDWPLWPFFIVPVLAFG
jgi:hypothetical protein